MDTIKLLRSDVISIENVLSSENITSVAKLRRIKELINSANVKLELLHEEKGTQETE